MGDTCCVRVHTEVRVEPTQSGQRRGAATGPRRLGSATSVRRAARPPHWVRRARDRAHRTGGLWPSCQELPEPEAQRPNLRSLSATHVSLPPGAAHPRFRPLWTMGLVVTGCVGRCRKGRRRGRGGRAACWESAGPAWQAGSPEERSCARARAPLRSAAAGVPGDVRPTLYKTRLRNWPSAWLGRLRARRDDGFSSVLIGRSPCDVTRRRRQGSRSVAPGGFWVADYPRPPRRRLPFPA